MGIRLTSSERAGKRSNIIHGTLQGERKGNERHYTHDFTMTEGWQIGDSISVTVTGREQKTQSLR